MRTGQTLTLSLPLNTWLGIDNPVPAEHRMTMLGDQDIGSGTLRFAKDYIGADYHNAPHSHIDALCHVAFDGSLYNGAPTESLTPEGARANSIGVLTDGLVGRGVLLDVPGARGVRWMEPGEDIFPDDLELCERGQGVRVGQGDILLIRTGRARRHTELGPTDTDSPKAGLHPTCMQFFAARRIAALGCDGNSDTTPSSTTGIDFPIHALTLNAMGLHLLDYLQFEGLRAGRQALQAELANALHRSSRQTHRINQLEVKLSQILGESAWRESGLGAPKDADQLQQRVTTLDQQLAGTAAELAARDEDLTAARNANRELMAQLNHGNR